MTEPLDTVDIAIVGAGPVGMALALALAGSPYRVLLISTAASAAPGPVIHWRDTVQTGPTASRKPRRMGR